MKLFTDLGLPEALLSSLKSMNFTTPTPIQIQAIPIALEGKDILGSAQTGTGKTVAFSIPLITRLLNSEKDSALVLTPTRELALQVRDTIHHLLGRNSSLKTVVLIGGEAITRQLEKLKSHPRIIIGTPGRINDHLVRKTLKLHHTRFLVLDETDRMLDMGFKVQLDKIIHHLPTPHQTLMFSATLPSNALQLSKKYLVSPARISIGSTTSPVSKIKQDAIYLPETEKYERLLKELKEREGSILIFVKTKWGAERLSKKLSLDHYHQAGALHGDLRQSKRDKITSDFRHQKISLLVATDIAARGLDISHIEHVINYDLPQCPEDYIHRIGRTGRAGKEGEALCFITPQDGKKWRAIQTLMNPGQKIKEPLSHNPPQKRSLPQKAFSFKKKPPHKGASKRRVTKVLRP